MTQPEKPAYETSSCSVHTLTSADPDTIDTILDGMRASPPEIQVVDAGDHYIAIQGDAAEILTAAIALGLTPTLRVHDYYSPLPPLDTLRLGDWLEHRSDTDDGPLLVAGDVIYRDPADAFGPIDAAIADAATANRPYIPTGPESDLPAAGYGCFDDRADMWGASTTEQGARAYARAAAHDAAEAQEHPGPQFSHQGFPWRVAQVTAPLIALARDRDRGQFPIDNYDNQDVVGHDRTTITDSPQPDNEVAGGYAVVRHGDGIVAVGASHEDAVARAGAAGPLEPGTICIPATTRIIDLIEADAVLGRSYTAPAQLPLDILPDHVPHLERILAARRQQYAAAPRRHTRSIGM